jgi:hypothetical protein
VLVERFEMTEVRIYFSSCAAKSVRMNNNNPDRLCALSAHCVNKRTEYMVAHALSVYPIQQDATVMYEVSCKNYITRSLIICSLAPELLVKINQRVSGGSDI